MEQNTGLWEIKLNENKDQHMIRDFCCVYYDTNIITNEKFKE